MGEEGARTKLDPTLQKELDSPRAETATVEAVVRLQPADPGRRFLSPEETDSLVEQVVKAAESECGVKPDEINVFRNLGTFAVRASGKFVKALVKHEQVAGATANRQPGSGLIPPHRKRPV
jgi:hypothetical protein